MFKPRLSSQTQSLHLKSHLVLTTTSEAKNQGHITKEETEAYETSGYCQGLSLHMDESRRTVSALYPHGNFLFLQLSNLPWCTSLFCLHWCTDTNKKKNRSEKKTKKIGRQRPWFQERESLMWLDCCCCCWCCYGNLQIGRLLFSNQQLILINSQEFGITPLFFSHSFLVWSRPFAPTPTPKTSY